MGHYPGTVARKRFGYVCVALGVVLAVAGLVSIWAFVGPCTPTPRRTLLRPSLYWWLRQPLE